MNYAPCKPYMKCKEQWNTRGPHLAKILHMLKLPDKKMTLEQLDESQYFDNTHYFKFISRAAPKC